MPASRNLVFMDSGIGGIPYLRWVRERRPDWQYYYVADNKFFPYGSRSAEELKNRLCELTDLMIRKYSPDIIILACNTASVSALSHLRSRFSLPFVGVVPAVKPAAQDEGTGRIGVLATKGTVEGKYLKELIRKFVPDSEAVDCIAAPDLVDFVENRLSRAESNEIRQIILPYLKEAEKREWTHMVLGCTHYIFLKPWLEQWKSQSLSVIDSTEGVGKRILSLLDQKDEAVGNTPGGKDNAIFHITDGSRPFSLYRNLAESERMNFEVLQADRL